jgi:hypothetical protein
VANTELTALIGLAIVFGTIFFAVRIIMGLFPSREPQPSSGQPATPSLDTVLMMWTPQDPFTLRDLLNGGVFICGRPGSGKSSSSSYQILKSCVNYPHSGGLILAASQSDLAMVQRLFAHQPDRLIVFNGQSPGHCFNGINFVLDRGGSTKDILAAINAVTEATDRVGGQGGQGGEDGSFFSKGGQRILENAIIIVKHATGRVSPADLVDFINSAATSVDELKTEAFEKTFHFQCFENAHQKQLTTAERFDYQAARAYFTQEHPKLADRTRSSLVAVVMNVLHGFNTGLNRLLFNTETTVTPLAMDEGKWIIVDMPISRCGEEGAFALAFWKYMTEWHTLRRDSRQYNRPLIIHADEIHNIINPYDTRFLGECRKFSGAMIACSQSRASFLANMRGNSAEAQVDALLNNFTHKIIHALGDVATAKWASELVGDAMQDKFGGTENSPESMLEGILGHNVWSGNISQEMMPIMVAREFMTGFRTGGKNNGNLCDAVLIRSGELFHSNGQGFLKLAFEQEPLLN